MMTLYRYSTLEYDPYCIALCILSVTSLSVHRICASLCVDVECICVCMLSACACYVSVCACMLSVSVH